MIEINSIVTAILTIFRMKRSEKYFNIRIETSLRPSLYTAESTSNAKPTTSLSYLLTNLRQERKVSQLNFI